MDCSLPGLGLHQTGLPYLGLQTLHQALLVPVGTQVEESVMAIEGAQLLKAMELPSAVTVVGIIFLTGALLFCQ